jgi:ABC-type multidrug transport system ATPase subunit
MSGQVIVNGSPVKGPEMKRLCGFVYQEDVMLPTMTVREAVYMSALLRLPSSLTEDDRHARVQRVSWNSTQKFPS